MTTFELLILLSVLIGVAMVALGAIEGGAAAGAECVGARITSLVGNGPQHPVSCGASGAARARRLATDLARVSRAVPATDGRDARRRLGGGAFALPGSPAGIIPAAVDSPELHLVQTGNTTPTAANGAFFSILPNSPREAPAQVDITALQPQFDELWRKSGPAGGDRHEQGGTLVTDSQGTLRLTNIGSGTQGEFEPNLATARGETLQGVFHTHPKQSPEQPGIGFSARDTAYLFEKKLNTMIAQSGRDQFMYLRTAATPETIDPRAVEAAHIKRGGELWLGKGMPLTAVSRQIARENAQAHGLAYYEGQDGVFTRVSP